MSLIQCTPDINLPVTMNRENDTEKRLIAKRTHLFLSLLLVSKDKVGITLNTSKVVDDG